MFKDLLAVKHILIIIVSTYSQGKQGYFLAKAKTPETATDSTKKTRRGHGEAVNAQQIPSDTPAKPRRYKGTGRIEELPDGRCKVIWEAGFDSKGNRRRHSRIVKNKTTANKLLASKLTDKEKGILSPEKCPTLSEFTERWLKAKQAEKKATTNESYSDTCRLHIKPALGRHRLNKLTTIHINDYLTQKLEAGLAPATVKRHKALIHNMLALAVREGLVVKNVAVDSTKITRSDEDSNIRVLSIEERETLLKQARKAFEKEGKGHFNLMYHIALLALSTGMRRGELLALKWENVDLNTKKIAVKENLVEITGGLKVETPKSRGSIRVISVSSEVLKALEELDPSSKYVFHNKKQGLLNPSNVGRAFRELIDTCKISGVRFHDLRHTHATELIKNNVDIKTVSRRLGHADVSTTLRIYVHTGNEEDEKAAKIMDSLIFSGANKVPIDQKNPEITG